MARTKNVEKIRSAGSGEVIFRRSRRRAHRTGHHSTPVLRELPSLPPSQLRLIEAARENLDLLALEPQSARFRLRSPAALPALPPGYYFKGGAAREVLRRALIPGTRPMFIRDYDLVRFVGTSDSHDHELAGRFMRADYEHGHGVEVVEDRAAYFRTRDLTMNEVLYRDNEIECTFSALHDVLAGNLRPTPYARNAVNEVQGLTLMKALRLEAEALVLNLPLRAVDFPDLPRVVPFEAAVHLDRAFAVSEAVAQEYVFSAWQRKIIMPELGVPPMLYQAVVALAAELRKGLQFFRYVPGTVLQQLSEMAAVPTPGRKPPPSVLP